MFSSYYPTEIKDSEPWLAKLRNYRPTTPVQGPIHPLLTNFSNYAEMPIHLYAYELIKAFGNLDGPPHCTTNIAVWTDSRHFPKIRMEREREREFDKNE